MNQAKRVIEALDSAARARLVHHLWNEPDGCHLCERAAIREYMGGMTRAEAIQPTATEATS